MIWAERKYYDNTDLLNAVVLLKKHCKSRPHCENCIFANKVKGIGVECEVHSIPNCYEIEHFKERM